MTALRLTTTHTTRLLTSVRHKTSGPKKLSAAAAAKAAEIQQGFERPDIVPSPLSPSLTPEESLSQPRSPLYNHKKIRKIYSSLSLTRPGVFTRPADPEAAELLSLVNEIEKKKLLLDKTSVLPSIRNRERSRQHRQLPQTDTSRWVTLELKRPVSMSAAAAKEAIAAAAKNYSVNDGRQTSPMTQRTASNASSAMSISRTTVSSISATAVSASASPTTTTAPTSARPSSPDFAEVGVYQWDEWVKRSDLTHWDKQRLEWLRKQPNSRQKKSSTNPPMDYDDIYTDLVDNRGILTEPVPLPDFLKVLVDIWYEDGVFNPPPP